jgi:hypothetical protein
MSDRPGAESDRPLANAGPFLVVTAIGVVAIVGLVLSLFRDPGLPAHIAESYMRVAGGLVPPDRRTHDPAALSTALAAAEPGGVRVPPLEAAGFRLEGGGHVALGGQPAAMAIYHNAQLDLVVWHTVTADLGTWPTTPDVRDAGGRRYFLHHKATTIVAAWQEGPRVASITSTLPADQVMAIAKDATR